MSGNHVGHGTAHQGGVACGDVSSSTGDPIHQSHDYQTPDEIYYAINAIEPLAIAA